MRKILILFILSAVCEVQARPLSNDALFRRCYSLVTQRFPGLSHPLLLNVKAGRINPITACLQILDKAQLTGAGTVSNTADTEAREVLNNFQSLHYGWMEARNFDSEQPSYDNAATRDLYDIATPAYYYTRALFNPAMRFSDIFTTSEVYGSMRTNVSPAVGPFTNEPMSDWLVKIQAFVQTGDLLGIRTMIPYQMANGNKNARTFGDTSTAYKNFGGGVLGSTPYLNITLRNDSITRSDGAAKMPRKWSRAVLNDFLCRELPVIRSSDIANYVVPASSITFRKSESCVRCHATMDQMAGTIRNIALTTYESPLGFPVPIYIVAFNTTQPAEARWPTSVDSAYYARPTQGRFVFRTYSGNAVDVPLSNLQALGQQISQLNDPYVCAAKRYYHYFMGVDIPIKDFNSTDPGSGHKFSPTELKHWKQIEKLGLELKSHQSVRRLIESILRLNSFRETDFDNSGDLL